MEEIKILIVEDDEEINNLIAGALRREGYMITQVYDGKNALEEYNNNKFKIILLDIMLPYVDGIEVMRRIRVDSTVPILIMSAKGEETDKIIGLGLGADDYIVKPFSIAELVARVKAQLRRYMFFTDSCEKENTNILTYGNMILDLEKYIMMKNEEIINLTAKEFEILKLFFQNPTRVFTKAQIFNAVWGEEYMGDDNTVMVHMRRVRNKVEDNPDAPKCILTVWGIGYKLGDI